MPEIILTSVQPAKAGSALAAESQSRALLAGDCELWRQSLSSTTPETPAWLTRLNLKQSRTNVRCLPIALRISKRMLDVVVAAALLLLTAPILVVAAIAIRASSSGPIVFTQTRVGINTRRRPNMEIDLSADQSCRRKQANFGRPFTIYKLRTMFTAADVQGPRQVCQGDSRVTSVGRILRKFRIDELPQLVNVLIGDMSMVGPRPECIEYMDELSSRIPGYLQRLGLKPGLTGIAQIESGYANDLESYRRKVAYDLMYLQHCCLLNDVKILYRTIRVVLTGVGAV